MNSRDASHYDKLCHQIMYAMANLQRYLVAVGYDRSYGIEEIHHINQSYLFIPHPVDTGKFICLPERQFHDKRLTELRVVIMLTAMEKLDCILGPASLNLTLFDLRDHLTRVRAVLNDYEVQNQRLSNNHRKRHTSARQAGIQPGLSGCLTRVWRVSFFQSRSTRAYEAAMTTIDEQMPSVFRLGAKMNG